MQRDPRYEDVVREVRDFLAARAEHAIAAGVEPENVILDPGIGFGKTLEHNLTLLRRLGFAHRNSGFLSSLARLASGLLAQSPACRMPESASPARWRRTCSPASGATTFRVHDVRPNREALAVAEAVRRVLRPDDRPRRR